MGSTLRAARRRAVSLVAGAALLALLLFLLNSAARGSGGAGSHAREWRGNRAYSPGDAIDASAWTAALSAGAEAVRHASAPRRAMTVR
jgi:hypothetical protein